MVLGIESLPADVKDRPQLVTARLGSHSVPGLLGRTRAAPWASADLLGRILGFFGLGETWPQRAPSLLRRLAHARPVPPPALRGREIRIACLGDGRREDVLAAGIVTRLAQDAQALVEVARLRARERRHGANTERLQIAQRRGAHRD